MESPDDMVGILNSLVSECIDRHAPLRKVKVTRPPAPWMNQPEIQELKTKRDRLRKEAHKKNTTDAWAAFRLVRNKLEVTIHIKMKRTFLTTALSSRRSSEVWRVIHRVLYPSPQPLRENPDTLNNYFITRTERTLGTEPDDINHLHDLIQSFPQHDGHSFALRQVSPKEVIREIGKLRMDCSTGVDQIPVKFIKLVAEDLAGPLTYIINTCIESSFFPQIWKTARISPIPKLLHPKDETDYRPISILPALSKVYERIVLQQLIPFIDELSLLAPCMSGFRKGHSTTSVLLGIRDDLIHAMKRGEVTMMVCADFSKAFDTVRFKLVLEKMHAMGFSNNFLVWMTNYLTERRQFVQIDDRMSELATLQFGVPQGSILGPMIFNLYVSNLEKYLQCPCYQYADDTTFFHHSKPNELNQCTTELNNTITRLEDYSSNSNLALNNSKTKWMLISTKQMSRVNNLDEYSGEIICNAKALERVTSMKILGMTFDEHLNWGEHITSLLSSCYSVLAVLRKLKNLAPYFVRKQLVETLIISKLDYCNIVYYPIPMYQLKRLQRLQNACAGFVLKKYASTGDIRSLNWLTIEARRELSLLKMTHKCMYSQTSPEYLSLKLHTVCSHNLRSLKAPRLEIPRELGTFQASAAKCFNVLPDNIRLESDYNKFSRLVKNHLLETEQRA